MFNPTLIDVLKTQIQHVVFKNITTLKKNELHDNNAIISEEAI